MSEIPAFILEGRCRYRNGEAARVLATDIRGSLPIASVTESGVLVAHEYDGTAEIDWGADLDLVKIPAEPAKPREFWIIDPDGAQRVYKSKQLTGLALVPYPNQIRVVEVPPGWSDPRPPEPTFKPLPPGISTPRQALADALRYYVNNPSAWKCYDQELSDLIKAILLP